MISGDIQNLLQPFLPDLNEVAYSSRYVLGLFFSGLKKIDGIDWSAKYIYDNPCIRYIAIDTEKRNKGKSILIYLFFSSFHICFKLKLTYFLFGVPKINL